jgi:hypothetical protein
MCRAPHLPGCYGGQDAPLREPGGLPQLAARTLRARWKRSRTCQALGPSRTPQSGASTAVVSEGHAANALSGTDEPLSLVAACTISRACESSQSEICKFGHRGPTMDHRGEPASRAGPRPCLLPLVLTRTTPKRTTMPPRTASVDGSSPSQSHAMTMAHAGTR